jgi:hypothetical protein
VQEEAAADGVEVLAQKSWERKEMVVIHKHEVTVGIDLTHNSIDELAISGDV